MIDGSEKRKSSTEQKGTITEVRLRLQRKRIQVEHQSESPVEASIVQSSCFFFLHFSVSSKKRNRRSK